MHRQRMQTNFEKVIQIRKNENQDQRWRRERAGLNWVDDYLLASDCTIRNCIYDGGKLKIPGRTGSVVCINAGYNFGFDVPLGVGEINFSLWVQEDEKSVEVFISVLNVS